MPNESIFAQATIPTESDELYVIVEEFMLLSGKWGWLVGFTTSLDSDVESFEAIEVEELHTAILAMANKAIYAIHLYSELSPGKRVYVTERGPDGMQGTIRHINSALEVLVQWDGDSIDKLTTINPLQLSYLYELDPIDEV